MPGRKRAASSTLETPEPRRRSGRISSSSKKSSYFEADSEEEASDYGNARRSSNQNSRSKVSRKKAVEEDEDAYEEGGSVADEEQDDEEDDDNVEEESGSAIRHRGKGNNKPTKKEEDEEDEEKEEDDDDGDGPRVTFIPHTKLRGTGGVEYQDNRLHGNTFLFLKDLKANNKRSCMKAHDAEYRRSLDDWKSFVEALTQKIIEVDDTIPELPFKDINFRIYRDIRFSKDPTPYKAHYSAAWSRTGKKGPYACYYVHCEPGNSFVGGGLWQPESANLQRLRESIDERPQRWRRVLMDEHFRRTFLPKAKATEAAVLKAFAEANAENALKTRPKGFVAEHRDIELLKLRHFTTRKKVPDAYFTDKNAPQLIADIVAAMSGFVSHLNSVVMPDPGADDDSSEDGEDQ